MTSPCDPPNFTSRSPAGAADDPVWGAQVRGLAYSWVIKLRPDVLVRSPPRLPLSGLVDGQPLSPRQLFCVIGGTEPRPLTGAADDKVSLAPSHPRFDPLDQLPFSSRLPQFALMSRSVADVYFNATRAFDNRCLTT